MTLIKDSTGHNLIGFKLKGFRNTFEKIKPLLKLSDNQFLPLMALIEAVYTEIGESLFNDERRGAAYKAACLLAANDNVRLQSEELMAA